MSTHNPSTDAMYPRLAAIDIGTNSIRLVVAEVEPTGSYRVLDEEQEMTRLGRGLYRTGRIGHGPMERSLEAIGKMKAIADGFRVGELRAIATSAVREAANGRLFCREAWRRYRVRIDVIASEEEAQLAFQSVNRHFSLDGQPVAVVDIGGGSLEVILATAGVIEQVHSLPLGAVRLTEQWVKSDPLKQKQWKVLKREIDRTIAERLGKLPFRPAVMVGSGGTFSSFAQMVRYQREGQAGPLLGYALTRVDLVRGLRRLRETPLGARRQIPGLNPKRADIIIAGTAAVTRLAKFLGVQRVLVNDRGVRDGVLLAMIADLKGTQVSPRADGPDRMKRVREFAAKCRSNERHCSHVAELSLAMFDALREAFELPAAGRDVLQAAALLHEVGYLINHAKHHKHAYHLIMHGELPGFSAREVELIANVVRYHRRALPKKQHENFARLDKVDRRMVRQLAGILRVTNGLDRTHNQVVKSIRCTITDRRVELTLRAERNPRFEVWDARHDAGLFEKAFGRRLRIEWQRVRRGAGEGGADAGGLKLVAGHTR